MSVIDLKVLFDLQERLGDDIGASQMHRVSRIVLEWAEAHGMLADRRRVEYLPVRPFISVKPILDPAPQGAAPATDPAAPSSGTAEGLLPPDDADAVEGAGGGNDIPAGPQGDVDGEDGEKSLSGGAVDPAPTKAPKDAEGVASGHDEASGPGDAGPGPTKPLPPLWTEEEDQKAIEMKIAGHTAREIAEALGRPVAGTGFRLSKKLKGRIKDAEQAQKRKNSETAGKPEKVDSEAAGQGGAEGAEDAPAPKPAPAFDTSSPLWFRQIDAVLNCIGYKAPWSPELDLALVEGLAKGTPKPVLADELGVEAGDIKQRFFVLTPDGRPTVEEQQRLLQVLRHRAEQARLKAAE